MQNGWVALLADKLKTENSAYRIRNESISGDTSAGGIARVDGILQRYQPSIIILELGANDGLRGFPTKKIKANLQEIVRRAQQQNVKVLLLSMRIPPNYGRRYTQMFYQLYPDLATEMQIPFVPFILEDVALREKLMQHDGLHPNELAQKMILGKVWEYLKPLL